MSEKQQSSSPPSEEEVLSVVHNTIDQLNLLADRLESFVGPKPRVGHTRVDDYQHGEKPE